VREHVACAAKKQVWLKMKPTPPSAAWRPTASRAVDYAIFEAKLWLGLSFWLGMDGQKKGT
jgi:hypothetical protein